MIGLAGSSRDSTMADPMRPIASILLVDDDAQTLGTMSQLMTAMGAQKISQASSAERALELLRDEHFEMIVADYRMPGMDGVQLLERLRARGDQTPFLVLSGAPDKAGVLRVTHQPRADFAGKPFRIDELMGTIERLLAP